MTTIILVIAITISADQEAFGAKPTVVVSSSETSPTNANPISITTTFSETMRTTGGSKDIVELADFKFTNVASTSALDSSLNPIYTFTVTPTSDGTVKVEYKKDKAKNLAGDKNKKSNKLEIEYDSTIPPVIPPVTPPIEVNSGGGGSNEHKTKPTFGRDHNTQAQIVEDGFKFSHATILNNSFSINSISKTITDNFHTDYPVQKVGVGSLNIFTVKVFAPKELKVQEFLFGISEVGKQDAELRIEIWFDNQQNVYDVKVIQDTKIIDDGISISTAKTLCSSNGTAECDETSIIIRFLEPLQYDTMAIRAIDYKNRSQLTYLNEGFDVFGTSLNPMLTKQIIGTEKYEGLITITQTEKYSNLWTAEDGRIFDESNFFSLINPTIKKGTYERIGIVERINAEGQAFMAKSYFDSSKIQSENEGFGW